MYDFNNKRILPQTGNSEKTVFCNQCGIKVDASSKFCNQCGAPIYIDASMAESAIKQFSSTKNISHEERQNKRNIVYEGTQHKCPSCGELLKSFVSSCPSCGYEIRDTISTGSIKEFEKRLYAIESRIMPQFQEKRSIMKTVFGKDFNNEDEENEARRNFEKQKEQEKISLILNYPIPNSKEDLLEFALLVSSNIDTKENLTDDLSKAWISKLEQIYQKAQITLKDKNDFDQISQLYYDVTGKIKKKKVRAILGIAGCIFAYAVLMGLIWNPVLTIATAIGVLVIALVAFLLIQKKHNQGGLQ